MGDLKKILFSWSGGKDSSLALHHILQSNEYEIVCLLTTLTEDYNRISMHGIRNTLLEQQAKCLGFPLQKVFIPKKGTNKEYESQMQVTLEKYQKLGVSKVAFGDIFLEDVKKYRDENLAKIGMEGIYPLWKKNTRELSKQFIETGFESIISCVDSQKLDGKFVGRIFNEKFLDDLPEDVDPMGENGEFHSFVYKGPILKNKIPFDVGVKVLRDNRFYFCDLIPQDKL